MEHGAQQTWSSILLLIRRSSTPGPAPVCVLFSSCSIDFKKASGLEFARVYHILLKEPPGTYAQTPNPDKPEPKKTLIERRKGGKIG
jgi:hypothetical protein